MRLEGNRKRLILVSGAVIALAAIGVAVAVASLSSPKLITLPTTGAYKTLTWQHPLTPSDFIPNPLAPPRIDPDTMIRAGADAQTILTYLGGVRYRLTVLNSSGTGWINSFHWFPPGSMEIAKVVKSTGGNCVLTGTKGFGGNLFKTVLLNPEIDCTGANLKPPTCTCYGDGGKTVVDFTVAQGSYTAGLMSGAVRIDSGTPVLKVIPSSPNGQDLKLCAPGVAPSRKHPCAPSGNG